jgi:hypothetical protein
MAWTNIDNALVSVGALPFATTIQALRDNPIAIANGDAGAPKVQNAGLATINAAILATDAAMVNWVLARNAGATVGVVGSYIVAWNTTTTNIGANGTIAGPDLRYRSTGSGAGNTFTNVSLVNDTAFPTSGTSTLSGTWRAMHACSGRTGTGIGPGDTRYDWFPSLWLRIS